MPVVLRHKGYKFFFYSNEGDPREEPHVHVRAGAATAKFWLRPDVVLDSSYGMSGPELNELARFVRDHRATFERAWHEFFGQVGRF